MELKKLILKTFVYIVLILLFLEFSIRVFHLTKDYPVRIVDEYNVEKWMPKQEGYSVTGNRRQNFSKFYINNSGYNSYREFTPSKDKVEIALVGDSFIEGFHQNYYNSIGKKIENSLKDVEVYEYGYAGYDLADQLHLIHQYKSTFDLIDHVILGINFEDDLIRGDYGIIADRMKFESPIYRAMRQIKLLVYLQNIGAFDAPRKLIRKLLSGGSSNKIKRTALEEETLRKELEIKYIINFENLMRLYEFDKERFTFLLDSANTPLVFIKYLKDHDLKYIDFSSVLKKSKTPTT
ncbi:MAG: hypothetical protein DRI75_12390, partial [Bacteroidetes bacterium]